MTSQIYKHGLKYCSRNIPLWTCRTCAFRPKVGRHYCSQTSTAVTLRETMKAIERPMPPKIKRPPFVKNLFLGKFDTDVLAFPEVLEMEHIQAINDAAKTASEVVNNSKKAAEEAGTQNEEIVSPVVLQRFKDLGYFGLEISDAYDGSQMIATEVVRMAEAWGIDLSLSIILNTHHSVSAHAIQASGSEAMKKKYLRQLARGEKIAAFCLTEPQSGSDIAMLQSKAVATDIAEGTYVLNGTKTWVTNGGLADVFLVLAYIPMPEPMLTAILIDRERKGVRTEPTGDIHGVRGVNCSTVYFQNVHVSKEDIVGKIGDGLKIATTIMSHNRLAIGGNVTGLLKVLTGIVTNHCIDRVSFDKPLMDNELISQKLSRMIRTTYAIESMTYMTAGLMDSTVDPDLQLEMAMVKICSSEGLWQCMNDALQILGAEAFKQGIVERWLRDARALLLIDGTNEILNLYSALIGCNDAGEKLADSVYKLRNPFLHPRAMFARWRVESQYANDAPKLDLDLKGYVHPSLREPANQMEHCVKMLGYATEKTLIRHGANVGDKQIELERVAAIATEIFRMAAVLSRCSRSYCIGLRNETHELNTAAVTCFDSFTRVKHVLESFRWNDANFLNVAECTIKEKGYSLESPITRNW